MKTFSKFLAASAVALTMAATAAPASAATFLIQIDQAQLDLFGTSGFGAVNTTVGLFTDVFNFTTVGVNNASSSTVTISLANGNKDIDFSSIFLDTFAFTQMGFDPGAETWQLASAVIGPGSHTITVNGNVVTSGLGTNAASYSGTLNIGAVPEPGTWALMIGGFGGAGAMLRSRRRQAAATA